MHKTATAVLAVLLVTVLGIHARGDRPGSYDNIYKNQPTRPAPGQGGVHGVHGVHNPPRHVGRLPHRSSISLHVGSSPAYFYSPLYSFGSYYPGSYVSWGPAGIYYNPAANYAEYYLPPTYMPAELNYGPRALDRFFGIGRASPIVAPAAAPAAAATAADAGKAAAVTDKLRKSNAAAQERAQRFLAFGDAHFLKQRCHEAVQRYKSAIEIAPDLPGAYYRQGFALLAVKQYRLAARALRIAVELDPAMLREDLLVLRLYGDNLLAKTSHLEQLADNALANPRDGDLLFLIGAFLYADGEGERAVRFLRRAYELAKPEAAFLTPLLEPAAPIDAGVAEFDT